DAAADALAAGRQVDALAERGRKAAEADLPGVIADLNKTLATPNLPLRVKRRGQAAVAEFQAKHKAWEKAQKTAAAPALDASAAAAKLLEAAAALGPAKLIVGEVPGAAGEQLLATVD